MSIMQSVCRGFACRFLSRCLAFCRPEEDLSTLTDAELAQQWPLLQLHCTQCRDNGAEIVILSEQTAFLATDVVRKLEVTFEAPELPFPHVASSAPSPYRFCRIAVSLDNIDDTHAGQSSVDGRIHALRSESTPSNSLMSVSGDAPGIDVRRCP